MVSFDEIDDWAPKLATVLCPHISDSVSQKLAAAEPEYIEDSRDLLFELTARNTIIDATLAWIRSMDIAGYHGSRLNDAEVASIRAIGLIPLRAEARRDRLTRALSPHPSWHAVAEQLDAAIQAHGQGGAAGHRQGQVHLTLSRAGLVNGFNHYLSYGAEFDQHVAYALLGEDGKNLLAHDGRPRVIEFAVPGGLALKAAHPHTSIDGIRARGDVPNLVDEFLKAWSYRLSHPRFLSQTLKIDCGMVFRTTVPAAWIRNLDTLVD